jgi:hypothetical protein
MPDRATIEAATPKCDECGGLLLSDSACERWSCVACLIPHTWRAIANAARRARGLPVYE